MYPQLHYRVPTVVRFLGLAVSLTTKSLLSQVRKHTAEQLYIQLLGEDDEDSALESVLETLSEVAWDGDLAAARDARSTLFEPLGLEPPKAAAAKLPGNRAPLREEPKGIGYSSLLTDAARGG